jgi:hypothetical protein
MHATCFHLLEPQKTGFINLEKSYTESIIVQNQESGKLYQHMAIQKFLNEVSA